MSVTYSDIAKLSQRIAQLEDFQNQTLIFIILATFASGLALGFIWAKYLQKPETKKW
jgi:hypothetical protein